MAKASKKKFSKAKRREKRERRLKNQEKKNGAMFDHAENGETTSYDIISDEVLYVAED